MPEQPSGDPVQPVYVRLPREMHEAVKQRAVTEDRSMAQTIRAALRAYLASSPSA